MGRGLVTFTLVGLPDASLREARDRVRSALQACELEVLDRHVTVGLSPAGLPKSGSGFDFAIAVSILLASSKIRAQGVAGEVFIGELGLDGSLHTIPGVLPAVIAARRAGIHRRRAKKLHLCRELRCAPLPILQILFAHVEEKQPELGSWAFLETQDRGQNEMNQGKNRV